MSLVRNILFLIVLGFPGIAWAQVGCVPNPNLNGPPFVDGCEVPAAGLNKITSALSNNVISKGADPTGVADSTAAFTSCLAAAGSMGTCFAGGGKFLISGNLSIPANTTLSCGFAFGDEEDNPALFANVNAIMLAGTATIGMGGQGGAVRNCVIYRAGMTFPAADSTLFTGLAFKDNAWGDMQLTDDVIMGFQTCVLITGRRPYIVHTNMDCQGSGTAGTVGAAFELDNSNTDSGFIKDIKMQPLATGNGSCTASARGNYGLSLNGIDETGGLLVTQNFNTDYIIGVSELIADGTLWADNGGILGCSVNNTSTSFLIKTAMSALRLDVNGTHTGIVFGTGTTGSVVHIGYIFLNLVAGNCIVMQDSDVEISSLVAAAGPADCGGYAIYYNAASTQTYLNIDSATLFGINGGSAPYIFSASTIPINIPTFLDIRHLRTDLAAGTNPYSSSILWGSGSERQLVGLTTTPVCTGLGSGSCALTGGSDALQGAVILSPTGSPSSFGTVTLGFPVSALDNWVCVATNNQATQAIAMSPGYPIITGVDATHQAIGWAQSGNLTAGQTYAMTYHCQPM